MQRLPLAGCLGLGLLAGLAAAADGQQSTPGHGVAVVPGLVFQGATFGDDSPRFAATIGPTLGLHLRGFRSSTLEATYHLAPLRNPHFPSHRPVVFHLQLGGQIGQQDYLRPSLGVMMRGGVVGVLGLAIGRRERPDGGLLLARELVLRLLGAPGLVGLEAGVQLPLARAAGERAVRLRRRRRSARPAGLLAGGRGPGDLDAGRPPRTLHPSPRTGVADAPSHLDRRRSIRRPRRLPPPARGWGGAG